MLAKLTRRHHLSVLNMRPIVAVIGTTGSGKSQLAVHLARSLQAISGERSSLVHDGDTIAADQSSKRAGSDMRFSSGLVLSADSMQLYKGLDVITNKVTQPEMGGVEHWGLNMITPGRDSSWELGRWCTEASKVVDALPKGTLPIICGGTHYFVQHFLFPPPELSISRPSSPTNNDSGKGTAKVSSSRWSPPQPRPPTPGLDPQLSTLLDTFWTGTPIWPQESSKPAAQLDPDSPSLLSGAATWTDSQLLCLYRLLLAVDPREAGRWHWRDGRKVKRGLERWWERRDGPSQATAKNHRVARFRTLIFWVYEPMETLRPRLDRRVEKMIENGLIREISELRGIARDIYGSQEAADHTEGIFQAIGYKEFAKLPLDAESDADPTADPAFPSMLDRMKISTHQYAKSQLKWVSKQLLPAVREARNAGGEVWVYIVKGGESYERMTEQILSDFLAGAPMPPPESVGIPQTGELLGPLRDGGDVEALSIASRQDTNSRRECTLCSTSSAPYSVMTRDWDAHLDSKLHRRNVIAVGGEREALIEKQRRAGMEKAAERARVREEKQRSLQDPP